MRDALRIPSEDRIYVLLANQKGEILWRSEGTASGEKKRSLETYLNSTAHKGESARD